MSRILLLTNSSDASAAVLPALGLLGHHVRVLPAETAALLEAPPVDVVMVDGRSDLVAIRGLCPRDPLHRCHSAARTGMHRGRPGRSECRLGRR